MNRLKCMCGQRLLRDRLIVLLVLEFSFFISRHCLEVKSWRERPDEVALFLCNSFREFRYSQTCLLASFTGHIKPPGIDYDANYFLSSYFLRAAARIVKACKVYSKIQLSMAAEYVNDPRVSIFEWRLQESRNKSRKYRKGSQPERPPGGALDS